MCRERVDNKRAYTFVEVCQEDLLEAHGYDPEQTAIILHYAFHKIRDAKEKGYFMQFARELYDIVITRKKRGKYKKKTTG